MIAREPLNIVVVETWAGQGSPRRVYTEASSTYGDAVLKARERMDTIPDAQYARLYLWGYNRENYPVLHNKKVVARHG